MKTRIFLTFLMVSMIMGVIAQNPAISLSFTAEDNGQYVPLDSIHIENLSQGCDTNLYPPDTVIVLDYITGIGYMPNTDDNRFSVSQNYPNPFTYSTKVDLYNSDDQDVNIYVRDLIGREVSRLSLRLQMGVHSFTIYPGNENIYLLTISGVRESQTIKMLNAGSGSVQSSQCKIVYNPGHKTEYGLKAAKTVNGFTFSLGDLLRYTGYAIMLNSNPGSDTLEDTPLTNTLYAFNIHEASTAVLPTVTTDTATNITQTTATSGGNVLSDGGADVTLRGVCWSTSPDPTTSDAHTEDGSGIGTFVSNLTGLTPDTLYYVRAYATNSVGTAYGNEVSFNTLPLELPTVTTDTASNITQTTATSGGEVTSDGGAYVQVRGGCWSTSPDPTTSDDHTEDGYGTGSFVSYLTGLTADTLYYVRAYATNSVGTAYGNEISFNTIPPVLPTVATDSASNITQTTATSGGEVISNGGDTVTARGVCWSTSPGPTLADSNTIDGSGLGTFISYVSGLTADTLYYLRAYATNCVGTAYGNEITFSTLAPVLATVTTEDVSNITDTTATSGGEVLSDGGSAVTERGVCWSISPDPTTSDPHTVDGSGIGTFVSNIAGLTSSTSYWVRAYATNGVGTTYGNMVMFATTPYYCGSPIVDIDGNSYQTVLIGTQCWMQENLKTTTYNNNTPIPNVEDPTAWSNDSTGAYCWYDNDSTTWKDKYGALYNWYATVDTNNPLCPTGWHVPSLAEFQDLTSYIGGTGSPHGNELKSCRQVGSPLGGDCNTSDHPRWDYHDTHYGTDDYGFSGIPGGHRKGNDGAFTWMGYQGAWWSTTLHADGRAHPLRLTHYQGIVNYFQDGKKIGNSVRCLRD